MGTNSAYEPSYSIGGFCDAEDISEPTYYDLRSKGLGPRELRYPGKNIVRITHSERLAWQQMMMNLTGEHGEAVARTAAHLREKGRDAAAKAVQSDKHISNPASPARQRRRQQKAEVG
jgi:hypothetical protein